MSSLLPTVRVDTSAIVVLSPVRVQVVDSAGNPKSKAWAPWGLPRPRRFYIKNYLEVFYIMETFNITLKGHKVSGNIITYKLTVTGTESDALEQVRNHAFHMTDRCGFQSVEAEVTSKTGTLLFADAVALCG
jgi:hypothetical protein